ncbi:MAG: ABC transporter ATP-binding protein [Bacteroidia bacterium]|jgi:ATP-binding cassette subfamily B protein
MNKGFKSGNIFHNSVFRKLLTLTRLFRPRFYTAIVLTLAISVIGPLRPYLMQVSIDRYISLGDREGLILISAGILLLLVLQSGLQVWSTILANYIGQEVIKDLRIKVYRYLTSLRTSYYDKTPVGTMVTRTVNDVETIADVFSDGLINIAGDMLQIIFILIMMFSTDWKLSLVSLSVLPFLLYAGYVFKEKVRMSFEDVRNQVARLNTYVQEHIQGMQIVQLFNRESAEMKHFTKINQQHRDANIRSVWYYSVFFPVVEMIAATSTALILWYGSYGVLNDVTSIGTMIAFILYINMFFRPIRQLADRFNTLQMGMVASERIFKLVEENDLIESTGETDPGKVAGKIEFSHVWFSYTGTEQVLKDISFTVKPGSTMALVGATGSGKTTIINLLNKFYRPTQGYIELDGNQLESLNNVKLRQHIGTVLQDVFLFSGTVLDNIRLYNQEITEKQVEETARLLGAHDFIAKLPNGYHQQVEERGLTLSVGQRQLISFVRAMVTNPSILVLDEATASIDHDTEQVIQQAIRKMLQGRTSIIIAHRLSTIRHVDEILVMDKGTIVERGNHTELILLNGIYKKLYEIQFAHALN